MKNIIKNLLSVVLSVLFLSGIAFAAESLITIPRGGTNASNAQSAIDNLTQVLSATNEHILTKDTSTGHAIWKAAPSGMVYPGAGIPLSTGSAWDTSITNNSANWNTAYGWGNHASAGYLTASSPLDASKVSQTSSYRFVSDTEKSTWNGKLDTNGSAANLTGFPTFNQNTTGTASTTNAFVSNPENCSAGNAPLGIDASGAAEGCFAVVTGVASPTAGTITKWGASGNAIVDGYTTSGTGTVLALAGSPTITTPTIASLIGNKIYPASDSATALQFTKADGVTNVMSIDTTNGRVGIGTTSPGQKLTIQGDSGLRIVASTENHADQGVRLMDLGGDTAGGMKLTVGNGDAHSIWLRGDSTTGMVNNYLDLVEYGLIRFFTGITPAERMRIDNTGNVGIGTTSPSSLLSVGVPTSYASAVLNVGHTGTAYGALTMGDPSTATNGTGIYFRTSGTAILSTLANGQIQLSTAGVGTATNGVRIDSSGNVGIGTTSPAELLDVNGRLRLAQTTAPETIADKLYNVSGNLVWNGVNLTAGGALPSGAEGQLLYNNAGAWTAFSGLHWDDTNNRLGIGTTSPGYALDVNGGFRVGNATSTAGIVFDPSTGNVGIGTTAPETALDVVGAVRSNTYLQGNGAIVYGTLGLYYGASELGRYSFGATTPLGAMPLSLVSGDGATYTDGYINFQTAGSERVRIDSAGNVGIGTTSPEVKLDVVGVARVSDYLAAPGIRASTADFYFENYNGASWIKNMYIQGNTGNVGISTTSPTNILSFGGNATRKIWMERNTTANTAGNALTIQAGGATAAATDKDGGMLTLSPGASTGTGKASARIQRTGRDGTGTADNVMYDAEIVPSELNLVDATTTSLFEVALPTLAMAGGTIEYTISVADGTDMQSMSGIVAYSAVNKGGSYTTQIVENAGNQSKAVSTGILTGAWSILNGTNKITIQLNADTSLTPTSMKLYYKIHNGSNKAITQL